MAARVGARAVALFGTRVQAAGGPPREREAERASRAQSPCYRRPSRSQAASVSAAAISRNAQGGSKAAIRMSVVW